MIVVTSLSPGHKNSENQHKALASWMPYGDCYSINCESEIESLQKENYEGIEFIKTTKTMQHMVGKPLVNINAFYDFAIGRNDDLLLTNSDIILKDLPEFKQDGVTMFTRYDYKDSFDDTKKFLAGFDVFHIPNKYLHLFPPSVYALGLAFHDYFFPIHCIANKIPIYYPKGIYAYHKLHETQYSYEEWLKIGEYFRLDFRFDKRLQVGQIATQALQMINSNLISY